MKGTMKMTNKRVINGKVISSCIDCDEALIEYQNPPDGFCYKSRQRFRYVPDTIAEFCELERV